jgi:GNAT superfamily N-acetyltransferase
MRITARLRPAAGTDTAALADLARRSFASTYAATHDPVRIRAHCDTALSDAAVSAWIADRDTPVVVAVHDGVLLGYAQWHCAAAPVPALHPVELKRLYVDVRAMGAGVGQALFDDVRMAAQRAGADLLWLSVYAGNERARNFYARQGMTAIGRVPYRFVDQVDDDLALGRHLTPAPP